MTRHVRAPRETVYRALLDADAIAAWRVPAGMTSQVHEFDAREGGAFRISLTYDAPNDTGKSASNTDTYHGRFEALVPDERVVEVSEFETSDPALRGTMTMTTTLEDADDGTDVTIVHDGIPTSCLVRTTRRAPGWRRSERLSQGVPPALKNSDGETRGRPPRPARGTR